MLSAAHARVRVTDDVGVDTNVVRRGCGPNGGPRGLTERQQRDEGWDDSTDSGSRQRGPQTHSRAQNSLVRAACPEHDIPRQLHRLSNQTATPSLHRLFDA